MRKYVLVQLLILLLRALYEVSVKLGLVLCVYFATNQDVLKPGSFFIQIYYSKFSFFLISHCGCRQKEIRSWLLNKLRNCIMFAPYIRNWSVLVVQQTSSSFHQRALKGDPRICGPIRWHSMVPDEPLGEKPVHQVVLSFLWVSITIVYWAIHGPCIMT